MQCSIFIMYENCLEKLSPLRSTEWDTINLAYLRVTIVY